MRKSLAILGLLATTSITHAANIDLNKSNDGRYFIALYGRIETGDFDKFAKVATSIPASYHGPVEVSLGSNGGAFEEGIEIGEMIHALKWNTTVIGNMDCISSCANIWLAGAHRTVTGKSQVAFHAPYQSDDPKHADGLGSAVFGMYLAHLGYSYGDVMNLMGHGPSDYHVFSAKQ